MSAVSAVEVRTREVDAAAILVVAALAVAPLDLALVGSLTAADLLIGAAALLMLARGVSFVSLPRGLMVAAFVFLLSALVSTFRATYPVQSLTQILQFAFVFFVLFPVILTVVRTQRTAGIAIAAFTVASLAGPVAAMVIGSAGGGHRFVAFYSQNPNRLGYPSAYLLPFILLFVGERMRRAPIVWVPVLAGLLYVTAWALAASASRGAAIATVVAAFVYLCLRPGLGAAARIGRFVVAIAMVAGLGYLLLASNHVPATLRVRVQDSLTPGTSLVDNRLTLDGAGLAAFRRSPFVGTGLDNFRYVARSYGAASDQAPHDMWVQFLAQVGLVGTLALAFFIGNWFLRMWRETVRVGNHRRARLMWAFVASFASIMAIYVNTPLMIQRHYWMIPALGLAMAVAPGEASSRRSPGPVEAILR